MKNAVKARTKEILLRVLKYMKQEPDRINMHAWGSIVQDGQKDLGLPKKHKTPPCGTTACLAGSVLLVTKKGNEYLKREGLTKKDISEDTTYVYFPFETKEIAEKILGITDEQSQNLFLFKNMGAYHFDKDGEYVAAGWPTQFSAQYNKASTGAQRYQAVKDRVLHFIKTGE